ncbi:MAG: ABC transporter permease subunit [Pseudomonadota bacterium]
MRGFLPMLRKELREQLRTYRLPVVLALFFLIGAASPLLAHFMPQILGLAAGSDDMSGIELVVTKQPDVNDAVFQLQKNFGMLPLIVILLGMGALSSERRLGTAALVLTKPVSRSAWVLSKFTASAGLYLVGSVLAGLTSLFYTIVLIGPVDLPRYALVCAVMLLALWVYLAICLLASALFDSSAAAAGAGLAAFALFSAAGMLGRIGHFTPGGLFTVVVDLAMGREARSLLPSVSMSLVVIVASLLATDRVVRQQEL